MSCSKSRLRATIRAAQLTFNAMAARKSPGERLAEINRRLTELASQRRAIEAETASAERRLRTRRAVIVGGWLIANEPETVSRIVQGLTRPQDRAAFGLEPLPIGATDDPDPLEA